MPSITCGNCKETHFSADAVRACYQEASYVQANPNEADPETGATVSKAVGVRTAQGMLATAKQVTFLIKLIEERPAWASAKNLSVSNVAKLDKHGASHFIDAALKAPKETTVWKDFSTDVPTGRYAVEWGGEPVRFYKVDNVTEGKWAGRTFVKVYASDETYPVRGKSAQGVLDAIEEAGIEESLRAYGMLIGKCGVCGRTLTDETSRAYGIGPVCRGNM